MNIRNHFIYLLGLLAISATVPAQASPFVVGGFDVARGGLESLAPGGNPALASDIVAAFPGTTFQFSNTLTPAFLSSVNVVTSSFLASQRRIVAPSHRLAAPSSQRSRVSC
jgi:hypothetical protein